MTTTQICITVWNYLFLTKVFPFFNYSYYLLNHLFPNMFSPKLNLLAVCFNFHLLKLKSKFFPLSSLFFSFATPIKALSLFPVLLSEEYLSFPVDFCFHTASLYYFRFFLFGDKFNGSCQIWTLCLWTFHGWKLNKHIYLFFGLKPRSYLIFLLWDKHFLKSNIRIEKNFQ